MTKADVQGEEDWIVISGQLVSKTITPRTRLPKHREFRYFARIDCLHSASDPDSSEVNFLLVP